MRSRLPTGGHMNRDKALAFQSPLTSRINLSSLFLNTFISLDTTTSSGREFHGATTRDYLVEVTLLKYHAWRSLPRSGHTNRDEANDYVCPLTTLICKSHLNLITFAQADRITSS